MVDCNVIYRNTASFCQWLKRRHLSCVKKGDITDLVWEEWATFVIVDITSYEYASLEVDCIKWLVLPAWTKNIYSLTYPQFVSASPHKGAHYIRQNQRNKYVPDLREEKFNMVCCNRRVADLALHMSLAQTSKKKR